MSYWALIGRGLGVGYLWQTAMNEIPEIILQCVSRDEAALAIAQKVCCEQILEEFVSTHLHCIA